MATKKSDGMIMKVNSMGPDIKAEMEAAYSDNLKPRTRNPVVQTRTVQALLVAASKAERKVLSTRNLISNQTTALMVATVSGYAVAPATVGMVMPGLPSIAERTIVGNIKIPDFAWTNGDCVACGSSTHRYMKPRSKEIAYPNANRPDAKENVAKNFARMHKEHSKKQRDNVVSELKWKKMGKAAKLHVAEALMADADRAANFNAYIGKIKEEIGEEKPKPVAKKASNGNVTGLPTIAVFNGRIGDPPHFLSNWMVPSLTLDCMQAQGRLTMR